MKKIPLLPVTWFLETLKRKCVNIGEKYVKSEKKRTGDGMCSPVFRSVPEDYRRYKMTEKENAKYYFMAVPLLFLTGQLFYRNTFFSLLLILLAPKIKKYYSEWLAEKRRKVFMTQFRDLLYSLSASVSAGRQMPEALSEAEGSLRLIHGESSLILLELRYLLHGVENGICSTEAGLTELAVRTGLSDVQQLAEVYRICRGTGGNLERAVNKTAAVLLDRIDMKKKVQMLTGQKRLEACILLALPFAVLALLNLISPEYLSVLYITATGRLLMTGAAVTIVAAGKTCLLLTRCPL